MLFFIEGRFSSDLAWYWPAAVTVQLAGECNTFANGVC
jgi:hypothetical protein